MAQRFLDSLPKVREETLPSDAECMICREKYGTVPSDNGIIEHAVLLPCLHHVGSECIAIWLSPRDLPGNSCPLCRTPFFQVHLHYYDSDSEHEDPDDEIDSDESDEDEEDGHRSHQGGNDEGGSEEGRSDEENDKEASDEGEGEADRSNEEHDEEASGEVYGKDTSEEEEEEEDDDGEGENEDGDGSQRSRQQAA